MLKYFRFDETAILIEWPKRIDPIILKDILSFKTSIDNNPNFKIIQSTSAYNSLLVTFQEMNNYEIIVSQLENSYQNKEYLKITPSKCWKIPVCYDLEFGIDLEEMASLKAISIADIIKLHTEITYTVYFTGFLPGFLYLGGLNPLLYTPRKQTPRLQIEKGAVAIGGEQTGVYPNESPGGWNVIGNSPITFFNKNQTPPTFAKAGDKIQFSPINKTQYLGIKIAIENNTYKIPFENIND